jgi:bifunctional non-homologous end joining protein LigD
MALKEYASRRRFDVTPEPPPKAAPRRRGAILRFVVQKHRASHLHYDFRLEWDGVLLSWAVPKGPSLDPSVKRLAMAVEDHPLEYADFEGIIPAAEYGAGTVMVWDRGTYVPEETDVAAARRQGHIKFTLRGRKLKGAWLLVRTRGAGSRSWLLIKQRDQEATCDDVLARQPRSILSRRLMAEIAFEAGGEVERAADADPPAAIRSLLRSARTRRRAPRPQQSAVWHSSRPR